MFKVEETEPRKRIEKFKISKKKNIRKKHISIEHTPFFEKLTEITTIEEYNLSLDEIIVELDKQAKSFLQNPVMEELVKYKSLVKNF